MSFSEQESVTVKRLEVAIRNSDMELLKDASYKLHEKLHEGYQFEMLQELSQILAYVSDSDIPSDIKDILCPTLLEILDRATAPNQENPPEQNSSYTENIPNNEVHAEDNTGNIELYPHSSDSVAPSSPDIYNEETTIQESYIDEPVVEVPQNNVQESLFKQNSAEELNYTENNISQNNTPVEIYEPVELAEENKEIPDYNPHQEAINTYQEQFSSTSTYDPGLSSYISNNLNKTEEVYSEVQNTGIQNPEVQNTGVQYNEVQNNEIQNVEIQNNEENAYNVTNTYVSQIKEEQEPKQIYEEHKEKFALFYYDKKSTPLSPSSNEIEELSSVIDMVDTDIYDLEKMLKALKTNNLNSSLVTTTQSIKLSEFLVQENISFRIPFVTNTTMDNYDFEIIPMYGLSNVFKCQKCNSKILSYSFNNKVLSVKCSNCSGVMYPEVYAGDKNINPYYWQRAFGALSGSDTWVLLNLPGDDGVIKDFIQTVYQNSKPKKIYLFPENNYYEDFFAKVNPNCEIITYQTQEKMIADFSYSENTMQALI